ncbi:hypothetical protein ACF0H5_005683 [Mactra antiquata]
MSTRSSRNVLKLSKPAPRKNSASSETNVQLKENELTCAGDGSTVHVFCQDRLFGNGDQSNIINKRSSRNLKVDKPAPLKSSTTRSTEDIREPTSKLIIRSISEVVNQSLPKRHEPIDNNHFMSQMSQDSGVGDMLSCSRQSSVLGSLSESPKGIDDLDWNDLVDSPTDFTLGRDKMQCTAYAVNQAIPFSSVVTDVQCLSGANTNKRSKTPKNSSQRVNKKHTSKENVQQPDVEEWVEDGLEKNSAYDKRLPSSVNKYSNFGGSYSALKRSQNVVNSNFDIPKSVIYKKYDNNMSFSDTWDTDLLEIPGRAEGLNCTIEESNDAIPLDIYSSLSNKCDDSSYCDKVFSKSGKTPKPCDVPIIHDSALSNELLVSAAKQKHVEIKSSNKDDYVCDENDNIKAVDSDFANGLRNRSEKINEREKPSYHVCKTPTKCFADEAVRLSPQDEGFNEQDIVWESIDEDLAIGVEPIIIDDSFTVDNDLVLKNCLPPQFSVQQFSILPDNFAEIEAELEGLGAEMDQLDRVQPDSSTPIRSSTEMVTLKNNIGASVLKLRDPLSPYSTMEEIWTVEEGLPWGMYTAKGRRQMFKNFKLCQNKEDKMESENLGIPDIEEPKRVLQYNADELLQLGTSPLSRKLPDSWLYLSTIFPDICLNNVIKYFDVETYKHERSYVVTVSGKYICGDNRTWKANTGQNNEGQSNIKGTKISNFLEVPTQQDFKAPPQRSISLPTGASEKTWLKRSSENINCLGKSTSSEKTWLRRSNENINTLGVLHSSENPWRRSNENINILGSAGSSEKPWRRSNENLNTLGYVSSSKKNWRKSNENINLQPGNSSGGSTENLNLDIKCDIHVDKRVLKQLVTENVHKNDSKGTSTSYKRSVSDPKGSKFLNDTTESCQNTKFTPRPHIHGNTSDLILKPYLPKNCPW